VAVSGAPPSVCPRLPPRVPSCCDQVQRQHGSALPERASRGPLTLGALLRSIRQTDEYAVAGLARRLGTSRAHLSEVEERRRLVSAARAARWARTLGYPEALFVKLALQAQLDAAGLKLRVDVTPA
jgi:plasmid maintenance system antidote protein VapI